MKMLYFIAMISKRTKRRRVKLEIDFLLDCDSNATNFPIEKESSNINLSRDLNDSIPCSDLFINNEHHNNGILKYSLKVSKSKKYIIID